MKPTRTQSRARLSPSRYPLAHLQLFTQRDHPFQHSVYLITDGGVCGMTRMRTISLRNPHRIIHQTSGGF